MAAGAAEEKPLDSRRRSMAKRRRRRRRVARKPQIAGSEATRLVARVDTLLLLLLSLGACFMPVQVTLPKASESTRARAARLKRRVEFKWLKLFVELLRARARIE